MGEKNIPVVYLNSAPWKDNLSLVASAKTRITPFTNDLKWLQVVNTSGIRQARTAAVTHIELPRAAPHAVRTELHPLRRLAGPAFARQLLLALAPPRSRVELTPQLAKGDVAAQLCTRQLRCHCSQGDQRRQPRLRQVALCHAGKDNSSALASEAQERCTYQLSIPKRSFDECLITR